VVVIGTSAGGVEALREDFEKRFRQRTETAHRHADEIRRLLDRLDAATEFSA